MSGAASIRARRHMRGSARGPGSLLSAFARHVLVLLGSGVAAYVLAGSVDIVEQPATWLIAGVAVGVVAALVGRGWLGVLFVAVGAAVGALVEQQLREGEPLAAELARGGGLYLAALAGTAVAYLAVTGALALIRRRQRSRRPTR